VQGQCLCKYGWDKNLIDPHGHTKESARSSHTAAPQHCPFPTDGWKQVYKSPDAVFRFNNGHIVSYFVTRSVIDGLPAGDFQSINSSAENLFRCGHIQGIEICPVTTALYISASCLPEMRKYRVYNLSLALNQLCDITYASCGCPAGMGPSGSCKHIGALCYGFGDFCKSGSTLELLTCTDKLQSWNKPRGRKVDPIPVERLCSRRSELTKKGQGNVVYHPRPVQYRSENSLSVERCDLLNDCCTQSCALLTILVPSVQSIQHVHTYALSALHRDTRVASSKTLNLTSEGNSSYL
jgi:hypothetical protein